MPKLAATRNYRDTEPPVQSDFDAFIDDIEILVNTILLDDDNFLDGAITASTKFIDSSVQANQIRNNNVTTAKIADSAVTTNKIEDGAVTTAKIAANAVTEAKANPTSGYLPQGSVQMFYTFNGAVNYPRGWMLLNGDVVNETNYDAIHGAGAYSTDGIASSRILGKNLPDMVDKYAVGVADTTKDGASSIASVGNANHITNFEHTHSTTHSHSENTNESSFRPNSVSSSFDYEWWYAPNGATSKVITDTETVESGTGGTTTLDVQPESIATLYIIKVI